MSNSQTWPKYSYSGTISNKKNTLSLIRLFFWAKGHDSALGPLTPAFKEHRYFDILYTLISTYTVMNISKSLMFSSQNNALSLGYIFLRSKKVARTPGPLAPQGFCRVMTCWPVQETLMNIFNAKKKKKKIPNSSRECLICPAFLFANIDIR